MNFVFAYCSKVTAIYPLIVQEIAEAQTKDKMLDKLTLLEKYKPQLVEDSKFCVRMANLSSQENCKSEQ